MTLSSVDQNQPMSVDKGNGSHAKSDKLKQSKEEHSFVHSNGGNNEQQYPHDSDQNVLQNPELQEGALFEPHVVNNPFNFKEDVLKRPDDEDEERTARVNNRPTPSYNTVTPHHDQPNNKIRGDGYPVKQNIEVNLDKQDGTFGVPASQTHPRTNPAPHSLNDNDDSQPNDSPTWLRRFSVRPTFTSTDSTRWKGLKQALKFGGGKKKDQEFTPSQPRRETEEGEDPSEARARMRASNLITSFISVAPAALLPGASFQEDEHGIRRAPLLLPMVGIEIDDITAPGSRHRKYLIKAEYGVGPDRLKWNIVKDIRDFTSLHSRLKVVVFQNKSFKGLRTLNLPKFPKSKDEESTFNTLNDRYLSVNMNDKSLQLPPQSPRPASISSGGSGSTGIRSRLYSVMTRGSFGGENQQNDERKYGEYNKKLEKYLKELMFALTLRPESNRLFQFLELSPLGVLLSYENGYQGKQGYLIVSSSAKAQGWRVGHLKLSDLKQMVQRHTNKWFLVRNSYIMYVSDIYSTTPLDVFLVDRSFKISFSGNDSNSITTKDNDSIFDDGLSMNEYDDKTKSKKIQTHFTIKLENSERSLKLIARSEYQANLWVRSIENMAKGSIWSRPHRFNSFAPVRQNCYAQWFVDGRDHFWAVSSALEMAKDVIYIHDWWLSPELYMRRPANGNQEFRLDRILKRKAEEGVKIFVIIYRNVGSTVVTDSLWTKHSLIDLHPNIHVIRSPNQWLQNTYFWAHHEKLCIIDHTVAFVGGIDLCYGRYDTPDHVLADDSPHDFASKPNATEESIKYQKFPGKDYSNPRVKDFYSLEKPYDSMYDRDVVPRMPWHDVHMMTAGQPASDLARHFVQRWNYLLRQKRPSRPTPLLSPPPEFSPEDLSRYNLTGTCEIQMVRSSGYWSLGLKKTEKSVQDAYLKLIETSEHFVYLENQFFITACAFDGNVIENRIGDALVDRIIRAHNEGKPWRAVIVIPLMPGFESQVHEAEGSSVRVIMQCQYMSISKGQTSIFAKLKKMKINPLDYIQFFSLRKWDRIGPNRKVVSEQLYIHAKVMIVDDRVALIGSANINERSQRGNRDSEVAAVVRDTETVQTTMNGQPYKAGKFAHTLRMRLMREHLGIDVDILEIVEKRFNKLEELAKKTKTGVDAKTGKFSNSELDTSSSMVELASRDVLDMPGGTERWKRHKKRNGGVSKKLNDPESKFSISKDHKDDLPEHLQDKNVEPTPLFYHSFNNRAREENVGIRDNKQYSTDSRISNNTAHKDDVDGKGQDRMSTKEYKDFRLNAGRALKKWAKESLVNETTKIFLPNVEQVLEFLNDDSFIDDPEKLTENEELILEERNQERWELLKRVAYLQRVAAKQRAQADDENAKRSKVGIPHLTQAFFEKEKDSDHLDAKYGCDHEKEFNTGVDLDPSDSPSPVEFEDLPGDNIPIVSLDTDGINDLVKGFNDYACGPNYNKFIDPYGFSDPLIDTFYDDVWFDNALRNTVIFREVFHCQPDDTVSTWKEYKEFSRLYSALGLSQEQEFRKRESMLKSDDTSSISSLANEGSDFKTHKRRQSIRVKDDYQDALLGEAPEFISSNESSAMATQQEPQQASGVSKRTKRSYNLLNKSLLGSERVFDRETADRLCSEIQGHLVLFPIDWLGKEIESGNWFYNMDRLPPIEIYD